MYLFSMADSAVQLEILNVMSAALEKYVGIIKNKFRIALLKIQHLTDIIFLLNVFSF